MELFYCNTASDGVFTLSGEESAHCVRVLRHKAGEVISVIDGRGTLYECELLEADPRGASAKVLKATAGFGSHPYHLTMAVCPTKNIDRYEWFVEKATEIGVDTIAAVVGDRSERRVVKTERLKRLVLSAAKQSLKGTLPRVPEPVSVNEFILSVPEDAIKMICYCFDGEKRSIPQVLKEAMKEPSKTDRIAILIGPEGDFSPQEAELALAHGWIPVTLGSSRLRTETAALVATTLVYGVTGEINGGR